ncbi:hypothetical protein OH491_18710 [Termitidicoccus mucosus]|uniref:Uncharacterized protein n=1 Tax=Termitidicoccus mucosus TaxID=1184151 RepID=A0A178ILE0_9BACT|nr:hypothetical protein AW736_09910 [Opitutaceae bacterium TSB47]
MFCPLANRILARIFGTSASAACRVPHGNRIRLTWLAGLVLPACLLAGQAPAKIHDYADDHALATTTVDISSISTHPVRLIDILTLVENQTNFEFIYLPRQIPLNHRIAFESGKSITLARLFYSISSLTGVVFTRHTLKVTVRRSSEGDPLGAPPATL